MTTDNQPSTELKGDWYCKNHGYIVSQRVTFHETCDECHEPVVFHEVEENLIESINETAKLQKTNTALTASRDVAVERVKGLEEGLTWIRDYPYGKGRVTKEGYPSEIVYDQFAYERIVDSYRDQAKDLLS